MAFHYTGRRFESASTAYLTEALRDLRHLEMLPLSYPSPLTAAEWRESVVRDIAEVEAELAYRRS